MSQCVISRPGALGLFFLCAAQVFCGVARGGTAAPTENAAAPAATADSKDSAAINACELLRGPEISQVIGAAVGAPAREDAGVGSNGAYSSSCVWEIEVANPTKPAEGAPLGGKSFVILHAMQWPRGSGLAHTFLDSFWVAAADGDIPGAPVSRKLGDDALWWGDGLAVRRYDVSFGISVFFPGAKDNHTGALEERLAPQILRRIEQRESELKQQPRKARLP